MALNAFGMQVPDFDRGPKLTEKQAQSALRKQRQDSAKQTQAHIQQQAARNSVVQQQANQVKREMASRSPAQRKKVKAQQARQKVSRQKAAFRAEISGLKKDIREGVKQENARKREAISDLRSEIQEQAQPEIDRRNEQMKAIRKELREQRAAIVKEEKKLEREDRNKVLNDLIISDNGEKPKGKKRSTNSVKWLRELEGEERLAREFELLESLRSRGLFVYSDENGAHWIEAKEEDWEADWESKTSYSGTDVKNIIQSNSDVKVDERTFDWKQDDRSEMGVKKDRPDWDPEFDIFK